MITASRVVQWAEKHKILITTMSVIGSFAGLIFSSLDLRATLLEKKKREEEEREHARPADDVQ